MLNRKMIPKVSINSVAILMHGWLKATLGAAVVCALLSGCVPKSPGDFTNERELYNYTMQLVIDGDNPEALKFLRAFRNRYPTSEQTPEIELLIGDILFKQSDYIEAVAIYEQFQRRHPTHSRVTYATMQTGLSYEAQIPKTTDRDQNNVIRAITQFEKLANHPTYGEQARQKIEAMRLQLAQRHRYVANYYMKRKKWQAAEGRLRILISDFKFADLRQQALADLVKVYLKLKKPQAAQTSLDQLKSEAPEFSGIGELAAKINRKKAK